MCALTLCCCSIVEATDCVSSSGLVVLYTWTCTVADYHLLLSYCGHLKWMAVICNNVTLLFIALINKLIVSSLYRMSLVPPYVVI